MRGRPDWPPWLRRRKYLIAKIVIQQNMERHHRGDELRKLNLSEEQKAKFKALHEENRKQMEELRKNDNITVKEWRDQERNHEKRTS